jgi:uncharacterized protein (DUF924 family)
VTWTAEILDFWFGLEEQRHWRKDPALDAEIQQRFEALIGEQTGWEPETFLGAADDALAAVILFDQFPRNIYRDDARAFATDPLARRIASEAIERGYDQQVSAERRLFFYLPFEHSEEIADQDRSVALTAALGNADWAEFARKHRDVIARFGRFPHRNAALGRESTAAEIAFGLEPAW